MKGRPFLLSETDAVK